MPVNINSTEGQAVRKLVPLATLPSVHFETLCTEVDVRVMAKGDSLFKLGDEENDLVYLISGKVALQADALLVEVIEANTDSALFALAHQVPRKIDAVALETIRYLKIPSEMIYQPEVLAYKNIDMDAEANDKDWTKAILSSPVFLKLPAENRQKILSAFEEVSIKEGGVVLNQGNPGRYYYLIKSGHCLLTRKSSQGSKEIKLVELKPYESFGEGPLISQQPANATITALTDMTLLRLNKENFEQLIKQPIINYIDYGQLADELTQGVLLIDVRSPDEYHGLHLKKSVNIPIYSLRSQLKSLQRWQKLIVVCSNGVLSATAAFLLIKNKFSVQVLNQGLESVPLEHKKDLAVYEIDNAGVETNNFLPEQDDSRALQNKDDEGSQIKRLITKNEALEKEVAKLRKLCQHQEKERAGNEKELRVLYRQITKQSQLLDKLRQPATKPKL